MHQAPNTVLISGAAKRIGRHVALHLARAGWDVAIHYSQSETEALALKQEIEALGRRACCLQADFNGAWQADDLIQTAVRALGPLGCLICNASVFEKDTLGTVTAEHFMHHQRVNTLAPLLLVQAFAAHIKHHNLTHASALLIGDSARGWSLSSKYLSYALSKLTLMALPELLALELAPNIRINAVAPGPSLPGKNDETDTFKRLAVRSPLNQLSSPDEVCRTIDFLLATPTITGQTILLSSGFHLHQPIEWAGH